MQVAPLPDASIPSWLPVWTLLILAGGLLSLATLWLLARPRGRWAARLRERFVLGVPWGTLLTIFGVACVYWFLQGGWNHPYNPVVVPFRSWSYLYPLGVLTAAFSHASLGHVTGNLLGTLVFAPIVEYAWGHFPTERGSQSFSSLRTNPVARIVAIPVAAFVVGVLTSAFAVGPVIGFSGVVFALAGFALVHYPLATVFALVSGRVLNLVYNAFQNPTVTAEAAPRFVTPWWANIAIQGHALGLLLGLVLGAALAYVRGARPSPARLWFATLAFAVFENLWAVYWFRGGGRFVLYRGGGLALVLVLVALVTAAMTASDRYLVERIDLRRREAAVGLLLALTLSIGFAAVPTNLVTVGGDSLEDGVQVRDYRITYAEDVPDRYVSFVNVSFLGETTQVNTSGVVVVSERRQVFRTAVRKSELAFQGRSRVTVGGIGWRETVAVNRTGWNLVGNSSVYKVFVRVPGEPRRLTFAAEPATVEPQIADRRIVVSPTGSGFDLVVREGNRTLGSAPVPTAGNNVTAGGLTFNKTSRSIFVLRNGTRVRVASEDRGQRER